MIFNSSILNELEYKMKIFEGKRLRRQEINKIKNYERKSNYEVMENNGRTADNFQSENSGRLG